MIVTTVVESDVSRWICNQIRSIDSAQVFRLCSWMIYDLYICVAKRIQIPVLTLQYVVNKKWITKLTSYDMKVLRYIP